MEGDRHYVYHPLFFKIPHFIGIFLPLNNLLYSIFLICPIFVQFKSNLIQNNQSNSSFRRVIFDMTIY